MSDEEIRQNLPAVEVAMYPEADDHKTYVVDLELDFFHGTVLVKDGVVVEAPQMLKWTQEYPDGNARETPLKDVMEWYKRPNKPAKDDDGNETGETKDPEFKSAKIVAVLNR